MAGFPQIIRQRPRPSDASAPQAESWADNPVARNAPRDPTALPADGEGDQHGTLSHLDTLRPVVPLGDGRHTPQNVALAAFLLGSIIGVGVAWSLYTLGTATVRGSAIPSVDRALRLLGPVLVFLPLFHYLEYLSTALYNPSALGFDSFVLWPDIEGRYYQAMLFTLVEFLVEAYVAPGMKLTWWTWTTGLLLLTAGQAIRTLAMVTAKRSFSHYIATERDPAHVLVTHGVYRSVRHPSYAGFLLFNAGLQIYLANPVAIVAYMMAVGQFVLRRMDQEEELLVQFFGSAYVNYQKRTAALIPYIY
ncbi:farnesyl cysteine-carboxyl methyltransferase [Tieghemiomyces parasiticus]|uniref:Protein-S-isoprenylcysteine O-methyltransferase n=1 Tax=Tieghemiomyces parasiticus TaxID=78921 RepID=A0A9W8A982_9FUNG|nr:farnesyl cysteine-carboxyl methyltransferase [Tieghemiomyces parasiticus]